MTLVRVVSIVVLMWLPGVQVLAQEQPPPMEHAHHQMAMAENPLGIAESRAGSETSWRPDETATAGAMWHRGAWMLMLHANAFLQYIDAGSDRGADQFGSINWAMGMAQRQAGGGKLALRSMFSREPATVGRCGYPALLQSGEICRGEALHDRQHPHDFFMELAADY